MTHTSGIVEVASASIADGHKFVINEFFIRRVEDDVAIASDICDPVTGLPSEANAKRIAALWNMAERLGLSTEEIKTKESMFSAAADMLKALEWYGWKVDEGRKNTLEGDRARYDLDRDGGSRAYAAIKKARGEE